MAEGNTLHDAFLEELRDLYDAERQITKALPKMVEAATASELQEAFSGHLEETRRQINRLEEVFGCLGEKARAKHCDGIAGILDEGKAIMGEDFDEMTMDASLIAAAQRVEHYEMAAYGTLVAWARAMGHQEAAALLQETLEEEEAADEKLSGIAEAGINEQAAQNAHGNGSQEEGDEEEEAASRPKRNTSRRRRTASSGKRRRR
jgi:ferritin-like metal-binding protein YciE